MNEKRTDRTDRIGREAEAVRIAKAEGFAIIEHDADWTFFTLDDGQVVTYRHETQPRTIRTHFEFVANRFEGFVS